jgi:hypothetical protein
VPARVTLTLDSDPQGADIYDTTTREVVGQTPFEFEVPGSKDPRRYTFKLKGYAGKMIELVPVENVQYKAELTRLKAGQKASEPAAVEVVPQKKRPSHVVTNVPGGSNGSGAASGTDVGPETKPPPETKPETKPVPETKPGSGTGTGTGGDEDLPGLKQFPPPPGG